MLSYLAAAAITPPLVFAHLMPWFESKPLSGKWGWHWTMGKLDPDRHRDGKPEIASHFQPMVGPYDSGDPDLIDYQVTTMKLAGISGVFVDWYGEREALDYGPIHRACARWLKAAERAGLKFAIVYEDQSVPKAMAQQNIVGTKEEFAERSFDWLRANWFTSPAYLRHEGKPVVLIFGPQSLPESSLPVITLGTFLFALHYRRPGTPGTYDWPLPNRGDAARLEFLKTVRGPSEIPMAYPRFRDFYAAAGVQAGFPEMPDLGGKTYETSLSEALKTPAKWVQVATWNDWGEGTQIEPSREVGYRDLVTTQRLTGVRFRAEDLTLPLRVYQGRKSSPGNRKAYDEINASLYRGDTAQARKRLGYLKPSRAHSSVG